jgi:hypothetical protein
MAKATATIRQMLNYWSDVQAYFAANQALFNRVAAFYFDVIQAHAGVLDLSNTAIVLGGRRERKKQSRKRRASTSSPTDLEQISHALRRHVEGQNRLFNLHQSLDRDVLELDTGSHHWA